jgi:hypothetical protein
MLSYWTWLPPLRKQSLKADNRVFNSGKQRIVRRMAPLGMRLEDACAKAHPFDKLVEGMRQPGMVQEAVDLIKRSTKDSVEARILINNRAEGNAPLIAQKMAAEFVMISLESEYPHP